MTGTTTVSLAGTTAETVPLHGTGETPSLGYSPYLHPIACLEEVDSDLIPNLEEGRIGCAELPDLQRCRIETCRFCTCPICFCGPVQLLLSVTDLNRLVTISVGRFDLQNFVTDYFEYCYRYSFPFRAKDLGHAQFSTDQAFHRILIYLIYLRP